VTGCLSIQRLRFDATNVEKISSYGAIILVVLSVTFPFAIRLLYKCLLKRSDRTRVFLDKRFGTLLDGVYGVEQKKYDQAIDTVVLPMLRHLVLAIIVTTLNNHAFSVLFIMYNTLFHLGYMLGGKRFEEGIHRVRFDLLC